MNVADPAIFRPAAPEDRRGPSRTGLRLIYHGAIPERYGLDLAIRAVDALRAEFPDTHLTIVGGGDHLPALIRLTADLGVERWVTFMRGRLAEDLPAILRTADVGIVPYRDDPFTDGLLPTKLMEYAAIGLPAVAARTTAIETYFADTVELFTPGSLDDLVRRLAALSRSPERLAELARRVSRFNDRYSWTSIGPEYVAIVDRLRTQGTPSTRQVAEVV
jgi:glycosyltransferase involved in cell wall biosynthesis